MALFDFGFSDKETTTTGKQTQKGTKKETRTQEQVGESEQQETGTSETVQQQLPQEVQDLLTGLITGGFGGTGETEFSTAQDIAELSREVADRARGGQEDIGKLVGDIVASREAAGIREITRVQSDLARAAGGSTQSSLVAAGTADAITNLQSELAGVEGALNLEGRANITEEFATALAGLGAAPQAATAEAATLTQLVDSLRGATVRQTTQEQATQTTAESLKTTETLLAVLDQIIKTRSTTETSGLDFGFSI